jgi:hypothetical protein
VPSVLQGSKHAISAGKNPYRSASIPWIPQIECQLDFTNANHLMAERPTFAPPPTRERLCRNIDANVLQRLGTEMAIVWPLDARRGVIPSGVGLESVDREPHDLRKELADLILSQTSVNHRPILSDLKPLTLVYLSSLENCKTGGSFTPSKPFTATSAQHQLANTHTGPQAQQAR